MPKSSVECVIRGSVSVVVADDEKLILINQSYEMWDARCSRLRLTFCTRFLRGIANFDASSGSVSDLNKGID